MFIKHKFISLGTSYLFQYKKSKNFYLMYETILLISDESIICYHYAYLQTINFHKYKCRLSYGLYVYKYRFY